MLSEEAGTEDSVGSLGEVNSLDNDFDRMHFEPGNSHEEIFDDEVDLDVWSEIESNSDGEFLEDHGIVEQVMPTPENNTITRIDCCRHFIICHLTSCLRKKEKEDVFLYSFFL